MNLYGLDRSPSFLGVKADGSLVTSPDTTDVGVMTPDSFGSDTQMETEPPKTNHIYLPSVA